jgi:hypothetical protein
MVSKPVKNAGGLQASAPIVLVVVVLLVIFAGWIGYRSLYPPSDAVTPPKSANVLRMEKIYNASGGDIEKLSPEDRQWLKEYSGGREKEAFAFYKGSTNPNVPK